MSDQNRGVDFLNQQGPKIDPIFGGLAVREDGSLRIPDHYRMLQPALQSYLIQNGRYNLASDKSGKKWEALFVDIATAEARLSGTDRGPFDIFDRMIVKIGQRADQIDPWVNLIPNEFGLCIVKSAFAIMLDNAREYSDRRQAIFDCFITIRDILGDASSRGVHFQTEPNVYRQAGDLYEAVVIAISDLLYKFKTRNHRRWQFKSRDKGQDPIGDTHSVLKKVTDSAKALSQAVENCRDAVIKKTGQDANKTLAEVQFIGWKATEIKHAVYEVKTGQNEQSLMLQRLQQTQQTLLDLAESRDEANTKLLDSLRQQQKKDQITIMKLEKLVNEQQSRADLFAVFLPRVETSRAVISLDRLFKILCAFSPVQTLAESTPLQLDILDLRQSELQLILTTTKFSQQAQSQAHSVLSQTRFFDWMHQCHPDMLIVDGNIQQAARDSVSPMSLLCANLGLTMGKREPDSVFAYFYCGLHTSYHSDDWYGPSGMLRSLIVQLLMALIERDALDLSVLHKRSYVRGIESHDMETLSDLFHDLICQFDSDSTVYCIVDNISVFDADLRNSFPKLEVALRRLQEIIRDDELRPKLKVFMTVPFRSSARLKQRIHEEFSLALPSQVLGPRDLSERAISASVSRSLPGLDSSKAFDQSSEGASCGEEDYDET